MEREKLIQEIAKHEWMHTIDLGQGVVTPGRWPVNENVIQAYERIDFQGKKVLDIGTCNGLWSFEAERRGATEVHSIDYLTHVGYWCTPAYQLAHEALGSRAVYQPDLNVYDVEQLGVNDFDVVVFSGVYYHLKHPLLALSKLRRVMKEGAHIIIEGPIYPDEQRCYATFHYRDLLFGDKSNWCVPTLRCLREWVECSFFDVEQEYFNRQEPFSRMSRLKASLRSCLGMQSGDMLRTVMLARAVARNDTLYSGVDPDLAEFYR
jgi:tRNA (mo5U34)-methyltransferase